jgi:hypothetical protein
MSGYDKKDAARDTQTTPAEVSRTWHEARTVSGVRSGGDGDKPTAQNRADGLLKTAEIIERGRASERAKKRERQRSRER